MFKSDKIYEDASEYVCNHEDYNIVRSWEHYYMARQFVEENLYKYLNADYEYYASFMKMIQ